MLKVKNVLISVFDKENVVEFARELESLGATIFATGGTAEILNKGGVKARLLQELTGFPEILGGKVKTLHPDIFARILSTEEETKILRMSRFNMLVINLYPPHIEPDIGGVALIRAGIKAGERTLVVTDKNDYNLVCSTIRREGGIPYDLLERLNRKAAHYVIKYQLENYVKYFRWNFIPYVFEIYTDLRYGTNPERKGFVAIDGSKPGFETLKGDISLNNLYDADSAIRCAFALKRILKTQAACIVKHGSPCGAAAGEDLIETIKLAWESDPRSAYGGILSTSFPITEHIATELKGKFLEVIAAPDFESGAIDILSTKRARLIKVNEEALKRNIVEIKSVLGGFIYEEYNDRDEDIKEEDFKPSYNFDFTENDIKELMFSYTIARFGKSNCVTITSNYQIWGIGVGMTSRVDAAGFAAKKFQEFVNSSPADRIKSRNKFYVSSDGFFPFPDSVELIYKEITQVFPKAEIFVAHPGGSIRDSEVIETAKKLGVKLFTTGRRCFRH